MKSPPPLAAEAFVRLRRDNPYPAMFFINLRRGAGCRALGALPGWLAP